MADLARRRAQAVAHAGLALVRRQPALGQRDLDLPAAQGRQRHVSARGADAHRHAWRPRHELSGPLGERQELNGGGHLHRAGAPALGRTPALTGVVGGHVRDVVAAPGGRDRDHGDRDRRREHGDDGGEGQPGCSAGHGP
jgi:hypothetical protein